MKENENIMNEVVQYLDNLVITINPGLDMPVPEQHPCQKKNKELRDDQQDYIDLINKLQRHTQCNPSYCLRINRESKQVCRFGYPKEIVERTFVRDDSRGQLELVTARNDQYINPHSRLQLQGCESQLKDPLLAPVQRLLLHSVVERDISAQETCHILLGLPLYHSSRQFVFLNLNKKAPRWIRGTGETEDSLTCQRKNIVHIFPRPSPIREGPQWEKFCRIKVVLHVRHQDLQQLTENGTIAWSTLYSHHLEEINADPIDILGSPIDDAESEIIDEEEDDLITEGDDQEEYRFDWMLLAEMGPSPSFDCSSNLGSRDMDRNYDWINDPRQRYSDVDLADADTFVNRISRIDDEEENIIVDYQMLNNNQKILFRRIESHYHDALAGRKVEPLRIIVMGTAGTRKTYLIKAIRCRLQEMVGTGSKSPMVVLALTGVAAFNIDGTTIHSGLAIPIINDSKHLEIKGERLKQLQGKLRDVSYVIIDEKSMIGRQMLALIDMRLRQAFPEHNNKPFGGRSVIMFGDFGQLPPVLDLPMYANTKRDALSNSGLAVYKKFGEVYKLETIQRQSGNSKEQQEFRNILLRMRNGESTIDDWKILTTRIEDKIGITDRNSFSDALVLLTKWSEVNAVNMDRLRSLDIPVAKIQAIHSEGNEAKNASSDTAHGLEVNILLARGARVMLTANLQTESGLVNGPTIVSLEGERVVPIAPIKRTWTGKSRALCSRMQIPVRLAWAITVHKSQGLTLNKAIIDLGDNEFTAGLSFVVVSQVHALEDLLFKPFSFERLQRIKDGKRLLERVGEEKCLVSMIPGN
ncbi:Pif1p [Rhizophagus irregularis DAOM 197198w]|uniref:ATP-dependent DNA helicase n=1 Tax=Rhizophagus irregularis (strain DAOM 197198w) TaxID=1432141 RepID=A0A015IMM0_RHIIW|nr:Pif1p [Rhizophagus irregularis DAOM 197198w]